jgi:DNA repair exonuclease SbcCD nuclease subunit
MSNNDLKTTEFNNIQMEEEKSPNIPIEEEEEIPTPPMKKKGRPLGSKKAKPVLPKPVLQLDTPVVEVPPPPPIKLMCDAETQTEVEEVEENVPCVECSKKRSKKDNPNYWKEYYAENKAKLIQQKKDWRDKNKDKINTEKRKEYQKEYDAKHKEKIKARRERLIVCECGETLKHYSLLNHRKKSKTHTLKIELKIAKGENIVPVASMAEEDGASDTSSLSGEGSAEEPV